MTINEQTLRILDVVEILINNQIVNNNAEMCREVGISTPNWHEMKTGKRNATVAFIASLCSRYNINPSYILLGRGDIFVTNSDNFNENTKRNVTNLNTTNPTINPTTKAYKQNETSQIVNEPEAKYTKKAPSKGEGAENNINVVISVNKAILAANRTINIVITPDDI